MVEENDINEKRNPVLNIKSNCSCEYAFSISNWVSIALFIVRPSIVTYRDAGCSADPTVFCIRLFEFVSEHFIP